MPKCAVRDWYSIAILRGNASTRNDVQPNLGRPEACILEVSHHSHVYPAHIPSGWLSRTYPMHTPDVSPDMSVSPTGRFGGLNGGCQPRAGASEAVESFSRSIRQDRRSEAPDAVWLEYTYLKHHPVLQYLPTKLAV